MAIRNYETLYIVRPELKDGEIQKIADKFKKVVEDKGGKVASAKVPASPNLPRHVLFLLGLLIGFAEGKD